MSESCPHNYVANRKVWIKEAIFNDYLRASDGKISSQNRKILFCGPVGCSSPSHLLPKKFKRCISSPILHQHSPNTLPGNNHAIQTLPLQATCKKNDFMTHYKLLHDAIHMRVSFGSTTFTADVLLVLCVISERSLGKDDPSGVLLSMHTCLCVCHRV